MGADKVLQPACLSMADHYTVTRYLKDLSTEDIIELGEALGLYYPHLRRMSSLLKDMVAAWLNREDNVLSATGDPSWTSLIQALHDIDQSGIARRISESLFHIHPKCPAIHCCFVLGVPNH